MSDDGTDHEVRETIEVPREDVDVVEETATEVGVTVTEVPTRGLDPFSTVTLVLLGTAAAVSAARQTIDRRRGGQMIDLRPGASRPMYRTRDLEHGIVVIVAPDGAVTVRIAEPDDVFDRVVGALPRILTRGASARDTAETVEKEFGADVEVRTGDGSAKTEDR